MTDRRLPNRNLASNPDSTALIERPLFSGADDNAATPNGGDVDDDDRDELTDPNQVALRVALPQDDEADAPTGRFELESLEDLDSLVDLPSAHFSEFDVSDLDGEVEEPGAATTIMQLPPSMMGGAEHREDHTAGEVSAESIEMMRWRAGPAAPGMAVAEMPELVDAASATANDDAGMAATLPGLSLDLVRAAAAAAGMPAPPLTPAPMPLPPPPAQARSAATVPVSVTSSTEVAARTGETLKATIDEALNALLSAQSCADGGAVPAGLHNHLAKAVQLLSQAQDLIEDGD